MDKHWLVYSREHNAFWRENACGYTYDIDAAGRYTKAEAERHCDTRDIQRDGGPSEIAIAAPEVGRFVAGHDIPDGPDAPTLSDVLRALEDLYELHATDSAHVPDEKYHLIVNAAVVTAAFTKAEPEEQEIGE